ncbi:hypothetical protein BS47DRAFT_1339193 [Hydnum rufescens UP504]|uniref:Structural maintenance of chromosomes protein n=1 Tax=Hydnum rufescens UP504 TaxID=1448309 RepID=A0A9P6B4P5_9AGAM|nr:hypothetical protein BS47DRAFT_1339193 [Hydnum rufescens UP504]
MPLLRIEVSNFKSYRGHQVIGPFKDFTSVIGPNGAGKSNLMDAISFVLGVKSAQLRSSQLKDLVYRGRRLGKEDVPDGDDSSDTEDDANEGEGTAKKAWVIAVYEDQNGTQYRFQRTISTSGASEYRLNNKVVTYQAYNQTLEQQNILVKAKNFLVFQGDVEAVASQSPKDLSRLIEQISGSLELAADYDRAKAAQDRATEQATFNYSKRRGIAGEIKQFKEQKAEADKFEKMCRERDSLVIHRLLWKLFHIEENINVNIHRIKAKSKDIIGLRKEQEKYNSQVTKARSAQAGARSEVMRKEQAIKKTAKTLEGKKPNLLAVTTQIAHSERKTAKAQALGVSVEKEVDEQQTNLVRLREDLEDVKKAAAEAEGTSYSVINSSDNLTEASLLADRDTKESVPSRLSLSVREYHSLLNFMEPCRKAQASVGAVTERQEVESLAREEKAQSRSLASLKDKMDQLETQRDKLRTDAEACGTLKDEACSTGEEINEKLHDCHHKLLSADVDQKESEREARLKETFATLQRIFPGVRGRVVDLCKPTTRKYEIAVSVVLGRNLDAVVVDQEKTAIDCIEYMRNQRAGQATFIPLDTIQVKPINDKFRSFAKGARLAVDVIQFDPAVERAMHHACGNALVCDTMEVARFVCYDKGQEVKAVTLDGTIIHKSGLITGGKSTHGNGRKWEEQEVQGLRRVQETYISQLRELQKAKPRGQVEDNLTAEMARLESSLTVARDDLSAHKLRLTGIKTELKHIEKEFAALNPDYKKSRTSLDKVQEQMLKLQSVVNASDDKVFSAFCRKIKVKNIREYEERQLKALQEGAEARTRFNTQINRLTHQTMFQEDQLKTTKDRLSTLQKTVEVEQTGLAKLQRTKEATEREIQALQAEIDELNDDLKETQEDLETKTKALDEAKRTANKAGKGLDGVLKEIASMNDEIEKLASERFSIYRKCKLEEIDLPLEDGCSLDDVPMEENPEDMAMDVDGDEDGTQQPRAVHSYGIEVDFEDLEDADREDGSPNHGAELEAAITKIMADIDLMVPNMKAMARLDDVEAKLMDTDKETEKARKEVKVARDEFNAIKKVRCDLFNKAYNHISDNIDQVYKDLTKGKAAPQGGVAYLSLEDSEEPYNSGIKYTAMPPMKRFRDMEQLSGGEKTVAALALLFAIHSYQPSPFFVLDEVDAALDNTNRGNSLVGIYRDQDLNSSRTMTLDLTVYNE